jgi:maltooligosyltrehalose synthase
MLEQLPRQWINIFTGKSLATNGYVPLKELFKDFPVALFVSQGIGYH